MTDPLVSIVTPSFNQAAFLEQALRSVLDQDYPHIEYLVVDGGSTDGSVEIIRKHADRLAWWVSEKDSGQAEAINKGFARARGEFVAWINSDDYYLPGAVAAAVRALRADPDAVLVYGDTLSVDAAGGTIHRPSYRQYDLTDLLCFRIIGQPAVFIRRAALERSGFLDLSYHFLLDHELWLRLAALGPIRYIPEVWAAGRFHAAAKNRAQAARFGQEAFRILEAAAARPEFAAALRRAGGRAPAGAHRLEAYYLVEAGQPARALSAYARAFFRHPPTALADWRRIAYAKFSLVGLGGIRRLYDRLRRKREGQTR